jgi:hypothetical protein
MSLYTDDNPKNTIPGTGFKDEATVRKTFKLIEKRSPIYQFSVINTMFNRAKYHPNQTDDIKKAMRLLNKWLKEYSYKSYPYLPLNIINKYEKLADEYNISRVARGLDKATKTDEGFLVVYRRIKGNPSKMPYQLIHKNKPMGLDWDKSRYNFINSRLGQIKHAKLSLFNKDGKYKGLPTIQHTVMIMNGYSPYPEKLKEIIKKHPFFN